MNNQWSNEFWRLAGALLLGLILALITDQATFSVLATLGLYIAWNMYQLFKINKWLIDGGTRAQIPDSSGIWNNLVKEIFISRQKLRKRSTLLSQALKRFRKSSAALPDATVILQLDGKIEWFNPAAQHLLGLQDPKDIKQNISNLIRHPDFQHYFSQAEFFTGQELNMASPLNPELTLNIRINTFGSNELLLSARDISGLQRLQDIRKDFVANVSHELRTPLTVISGYAETFADESLPDDLQQGIHSIHQQAQRMTQIVEDLLTLSRLEMGVTTDIAKAEVIQVPLILDSMREDALLLSGTAKHKIDLNIASQKCLQGNESDIISAFRNLIDNAVRHTPAESTINISWENVNESTQFSVKDNGPGIEAKHIPRLSERFYRVDKGRSRDKGGTGLGLSIVKHAINQNGGTLSIESQRGKGTTFSCTFPAACLVDSDFISIEKPDQHQLSDNNI